MRRTLSAVAVAVLVLLSSVALASPASAVPWRNPVDPYPDLPSSQYKTLYWQFMESQGLAPASNPAPDFGTPEWVAKNQGFVDYLEQHGYPSPSQQSAAKVQNTKPTKIEKLIFDAPTGTYKPQNASGVPKPATGFKPFMRPSGPGAAAAAFLAFEGGFAIGAGTLHLYGVVTGDDPLEGLCGSGLETAADWVYGGVYAGMLPGCTAPLSVPANLDQVVDAALNYGGKTFAVYLGRVVGGASGGQDMVCVDRPGWGTSQWSGKSAYYWDGAAWQALGGQFTSSLCKGNGYGGDLASFRWYAAGAGIDAAFQLRDNATGNVLSESSSARPNPYRQPSCKITWDDGSQTTGMGTQYREADDVFPLSASGLGCKQAYAAKPGAGVSRFPSEIAVTSNDGNTSTEIMRQGSPSWSDDEKAAFGDTTGKGLVLWKGAESCNSRLVECHGWWDETEQGTRTDLDYRCTYGDRTVSLRQCVVYRESFELDTVTPTITDPATGEPMPWTGESDQNSLDPTTGPQSGEDCMQSWPSIANPIAWVLHPVKCALVWAFIPSMGSVMGTIGGIGDAAGDIGMVEPFAALIAELPSSGGCDGLPFDLVFFGQEFHGRILNACEEPVAGAAVVVNGLLTLGVVTGALFAVGRYVAAVFGFVGPGGSIEQTQRNTEAQITRMGAGRGGD